MDAILLTQAELICLGLGIAFGTCIGVAACDAYLNRKYRTVRSRFDPNSERQENLLREHQAFIRSLTDALPSVDEVVRHAGVSRTRIEDVRRAIEGTDTDVPPDTGSLPPRLKGSEPLRSLPRARSN